MILPRAYGFIFSRVLVFFPFLWTPKIQGTALLRAYWYKKNVKKHGCILMLHYYARARIGGEIIYLSSGFVGHGGNRA